MSCTDGYIVLQRYRKDVRSLGVMSYTYGINQPTAQTAINILSALKHQTNPATLAYWVTPNTVLTLSGARAYCDGVFYHGYKKSYQWADIDFSVEQVEAIHQELFDKPLDWNDVQWIYDITPPTPQDHITNVIARRSGELRDEHILSEIQKYWQQGKSPFLVFGSAHAIRLKPALKKLVESQ